MQFAKDSFYMALRTRLAVVNPSRTAVLDGATRPAVVVAENEPATSTAPLRGTFYLRWGAMHPVKSTSRAARPLMALDCTISYETAGSDAASGVDRGRALAALDSELLAICSPPFTPKLDYTQTPPLALRTGVLWQRPEFGEVEASGCELRRTATLTIFFFPESDCP